MAGVQNFRSALGGFNREDVVHYIEYMNQKHKSEVEQLNSQLQSVRGELRRLKAQDNSQLQAELEIARARCAELEQQLSQAQTSVQQPSDQPAPQPGKSEDELEAYRRAERAERLARERASQIYAQANAALAEATVKVEEVSDSLTTLADMMTAKTQEAKNQLHEAVASMYAIRPEEE